jgi:osmoprotectant transport system substrate-binding protein
LIRDPIVTYVGMPGSGTYGLLVERAHTVSAGHACRPGTGHMRRFLVMNARPRRGTRAAVALGSVLVLALTACGGGSDAFSSDTPSSSGDAAASGPLTVGGANFTEMLIMQQLYGQMLTKAGFTVDYKAVDNREIYAKSLESGEIDVVPEYAATMTEYLNTKKNGATAKTVATSDISGTMAALAPLLKDKGLSAFEASKAADQNGFVVSKKYAAANGNLTTLSALAALKKPIRLAAVEECPDRPFCQPGLEKTYGLDISKVEPLGFGSPQTKKAVTDGKADLGLVGTTDGTLDQLGLVLLEDDKKLQLADNLVPVVNTASADKPAVSGALNPLASALTTEDLAAMNLKVDGERQKPQDVAKEYLTSKGLL